MRLAIITPYYKESLSMLRRCSDSVAAQTYTNVHQIFVSDGVPNDDIDAFPNSTHIRVPNHNDYGDTPRMMGALHAVNRGYDGIVFLDADNWFERQHLELMLKAATSKGVSVATATRVLWTPEGATLGVCTECDGVKHVDTNCFLLLKDAFKHLGFWGFKDPNMAIVGDHMFWHHLLELGVPHAHVAAPTVNYVTNFAVHWLRANQQPPSNSKVSVKLPDGRTTQIDYALYRQITAVDTTAAAAG